MIADFLFEKDKIFACLTLDNEELKLYERYFDRMAGELRTPELVIYLQATPEVLRERIAKKGGGPANRASRVNTSKKWRERMNIFSFTTPHPICWW